MRATVFTCLVMLLAACEAQPPDGVGLQPTRVTAPNGDFISGTNTSLTVPVLVTPRFPVATAWSWLTWT
ncbi:MAG: hypothetical protein AAF525_10450 [Pseudomonadota bacterium]